MSGLALSLDRAALAELADELAVRIAPQVAARLATDEPDRWLDAKAAAEYAGCTVNALHKATAAREVRFSQNAEGGKVYFRKEWIDEWRGL